MYKVKLLRLLLLLLLHRRLHLPLAYLFTYSTTLKLNVTLVLYVLKFIVSFHENICKLLAIIFKCFCTLNLKRHLKFKEFFYYCKIK